MADESCPERVRLVEELGEAINEQKHARTDAERVEAEIRTQEALEAVRSHKAKQGCSDDEASPRKVS